MTIHYLLPHPAMPGQRQQLVVLLWLLARSARGGETADCTADSVCTSKRHGQALLQTQADKLVIQAAGGEASEALRHRGQAGSMPTSNGEDSQVLASITRSLVEAKSGRLDGEAIVSGLSTLRATPEIREFCHNTRVTIADLLGSLDHETSADKELLKGLEAPLDGLEAQLNASKQEVDRHVATVEAKRQAHQSCRNTESGLHAEREICTAQLAALIGQREAAARTLAAADPAQGGGGSPLCRSAARVGPDGKIVAVDELDAKLREIQEYKKLVDAYNAALMAENNKSSVCSNITDTHKARKATCIGNQE